jgi:translation initiation factor IF-1
MAKEDLVQLEGVVDEVLPNTMFRVKIGENAQVSHPHPRRRSGHRGNVAIRFDESENRVSAQR